jgi:serine protease Do
MSDAVESLGVLQIYTGAGTGSGFLVEPRRFVTNCHVVAPYRLVAVELRDRQRVVGTVRRISPRRDLALVEVGVPLGLEVLPLAPAEALAAGDPVSIVGFPLGLPLSVTEGVVSNPRQLLEGQRFVQTDAAVNPGNSGGPMLDGEGRVVAVTNCKLNSAEAVGFGIPVGAVHTFVAAFGEQAAAFGVECPACEAVLDRPVRYCDNCGSDLEELELASYFEPPDDHPVVAFVEGALRGAGVDPVLARHGCQHWSFWSGSAPIKISCCCSEHVCFTSPLARPGRKNLGELFRHLLSPEHEPFAFDLQDNVVRLNLTVHMSDVFAPERHEALRAAVARFLAAADRCDDALFERFGCEPAPETQLDRLARHAET